MFTFTYFHNRISITALYHREWLWLCNDYERHLIYWHFRAAEREGDGRGPIVPHRKKANLRTYAFLCDRLNWVSCPFCTVEYVFFKEKYLSYKRAKMVHYAAKRSVPGVGMYTWNDIAANESWS